MKIILLFTFISLTAFNCKSATYENTSDTSRTILVKSDSLFCKILFNKKEKCNSLEMTLTNKRTYSIFIDTVVSYGTGQIGSAGVDYIWFGSSDPHLITNAYQLKAGESVSILLHLHDYHQYYELIIPYLIGNSNFDSKVVKGILSLESSLFSGESRYLEISNYDH